MARLCPDCGANLDVFGTRHRCISGKPAGQKPLTKLEKLDPAALTQSTPAAATQPIGRLAARPAYERTTPPARQPQPSLADVLSAIVELRQQFEKLTALLTPRTDA